MSGAYDGFLPIGERVTALEAEIERLKGDLEVETSLVIALKKDLSHAREYIAMKAQQGKG